MSKSTQLKDFGMIIIIEYQGATLVSMKRVGRGWSATDGRQTASGSKKRVLDWAKSKARELQVQIDGAGYAYASGYHD